MLEGSLFLPSMLCVLLFCLYKLYCAVKEEFFPEKHCHQYRIWAMRVDESTLYGNAWCICGASLPVYEVIHLGLSITSNHTGRIIDLPDEVVAIATDMYLGKRKTHRCV